MSDPVFPLDISFKFQIAVSAGVARGMLDRFKVALEAEGAEVKCTSDKVLFKGGLFNQGIFPVHGNLNRIIYFDKGEISVLVIDDRKSILICTISTRTAVLMTALIYAFMVFICLYIPFGYIFGIPKYLFMALVAVGLGILTPISRVESWFKSVVYGKSEIHRT